MSFKNLPMYIWLETKSQADMAFLLCNYQEAYNLYKKAYKLAQGHPEIQKVIAQTMQSVSIQASKASNTEPYSSEEIL